MMSKKKKPRPQENEQERSRLSIPDEPNYSIAKFISNLYSNLSIGGNMSEQGADKAGLQISMGIKFFFTACGIGIATALFLWLMPDFIKAIAETILMFKN